MGEQHVAIIGAGVVGISSALYARRNGWQVTLIDPQGLAQGASRGNAGVIATSECLPIGSWNTIKSVPGMLMSNEGALHIRPRYFPSLLPWLLKMAVYSQPHHVQRISQALASLLQHATDAHRDLAHFAGCSASLRPTGWIKGINSAKHWQTFQATVAHMQALGVACETWNAQELAAHAPALAGQFEHAVYHPECLHVGEPGAYVRALGEAALHAGVHMKQAPALDFIWQGQHITAVQTGAGAIACDAVIVATGAHSRHLAKLVGDEVPLDTERGYHMMIDTSQCQRQLQQPLHWVEKSIVLSPMDGGLRVTSSVEFAGLDAAPQYELVRRHLPAIEQLLPGAQLRQGSEWLGFRPSMPDSLPVIGRAAHAHNAWLAFGHGHLGLTLGPITGQLMAQMLDGASCAVDMQAFSPQRF